MELVRQVQIKSSLLLDDITFLSKNLYNVATYTVRQHFFQNSDWIRYNSLYYLLKSHKDYKNLKDKCGAHTPQQILKQIDYNFKSFFNALKKWKQDPSKFQGKPKLPGYKRKDGHNVVYFTSQQCRLKNGFVYLPKKMHKQDFLPIKTDLKEIKGVRIIPCGDRYNIELIYSYEPKTVQFHPQRAIGIDLGLNNIIAASNNVGLAPFIIKGGVCKSINQYYNKQFAKYSSEAKKCNNAKSTNKIRKLNRVRRNKIHNYFHQTSRKLINFCIQNQIGTIIIGYNQGWKQKINIGKRNNQNFVSVPFFKLINQIKYKSEMVGITVKNVSEEYTSQTCSGCGIIRKSNRRHRGLYHCNTCGLIENADVNAALNILHKEFPNSTRRGNRGAKYAPLVLTC